jgi:hypothetical protein
LIVASLLIWLLLRRIKQNRRRRYSLASPVPGEITLPTDHIIEPFVSTLGPQNPRQGKIRSSLVDSGLITTPFTFDENETWIQNQAKKDDPTPLPMSEVQAGVYVGDGRTVSMDEAGEGLRTTDLVERTNQNENVLLETESITNVLDRPHSYSELPADNRSTANGPQGAANSFDILRIFEDRAFEGEILRLIAQRMDPVLPHPTSPVDSEDRPPTYRPS